jgi:hypothetical protein
MKRTFFSILFICLLLNIQAQIDESRYVHLSVEEGLAARSVFDIEMDHQGFIWVGSEMGLNRYNGQRFKLYFHDENDPFSINGNFIRDIFEDSNNNLWIACHGICLYNSYYDDFINFENDENDPKTLDNNMTNGFYEDHEGYLWFGHWDGAARINTKVSDIHIEKYGPTKKLSLEFTNYILNEDASVNGYITNFFEDHHNNLWMCGRDGGLYKLDRKTDKITKIKKGVNGVQIDDQIRAAYKEGNIVWLGTWDHYFYKLTLTDSGPLVEKLQNKTDFLLYDHNQINDIDPFENENLLLSHQAGFSIFDKKETFFNYSYHPDKKHNLLSREVTCSYIDHTGSIWFGTLDGGVNYLPVKLKYFNVLQNDLSNPNSIPTNFVEKIVSNGKNLIFVYLRDGGGWLWFKPYSNSVEKSPVYFINDIHIHLIDSTAVFYYKKQIVFKDVFTKKTVKIPFSIKGNIHLHAPEKELWIRTEQGYINLDNAGNIKERILHDKNNDRSVKLHKNKYTIKRVHKNYLFCILWDKGMEIVNLDTREAFISESINIKNLKALYPYDNTASLFYIVKNGQINN